MPQQNETTARGASWLGGRVRIPEDSTWHTQMREIYLLSAHSWLST